MPIGLKYSNESKIVTLVSSSQVLARFCLLYLACFHSSMREDMLVDRYRMGGEDSYSEGSSWRISSSREGKTRGC